MTNSIESAKAEMLIRKPAQEVFEAFVNPAITSKFWFTKSTGPLEEGKNLTWTWEMYNLDVPVTVLSIDPKKSIEIQWGEGKQQSKVKWDFNAIAEDRTFVTITNYDFYCTPEELVNQLIDSTGGFTLVIAGLKAWIEHGLQLNLVGDKFPKEMMSN